MNTINKNDNSLKGNSISMKVLYTPSKQLLFDMDKNKYFIKNSESTKLFESNLLGKKKVQINLPQTGLATYSERIKTNSVDKISFKVDDSLYHPQSLRFEGYSQFPRPLVLPFSNITKTKLQKNLISDLTKNDGIFTLPKNKEILNKKTNEGLYFYSGTINNLVNTKNKEYVLKKINDTLEYEENNNKLNYKEKMRNHEKNALKKLKRKILTNSTNNIFGRKLKKPDDKFINQYNINYNVYFNNPIEKNKLKNENTIESKFYFEELYNTLSKKRVQKKLNYNELNLEIKEEINNNINSKNYFLNKNRVDSKIKNKFNRNLFYDSRNNTQDKNKIININIQGINNSITNTATTTHTNIKKETNNNNFFNSLLLSKNKFNTLENKSKLNYEELLSEENRNLKDFSNNNYNKEGLNNILSIRTLNDIKKKCFNEKKLLKGFIRPIIKEAHFRKSLPKYNSAINIYKKELDIYKKVNHIRYKLDEEKELREIKLIKEKLNKEKEVLHCNLAKSRKNKFFSSSNLLSS